MGKRTNYLYLIVLLVLISPIISSEFGYNKIDSTNIETTIVNSNITNLSEMLDTNIDGSQTNNQVLTWNDAQQLWVPQAAGAVGDTNASLCPDNTVLMGDGYCLNLNDTIDDRVIVVSDTNETARFINLTSLNCPGTEKMIGVYPNGTVECSADLQGAGGSGNPFDQSLNISDSVNFSNVNVSNNMWIGSADEDHFIYFYDDSNPEGAKLFWNDTGRFDFSHAVHTVNGFFSDIVSVFGGVSSTEDIWTTGAGDNLWLGSPTQANAKFTATSDGNLSAIRTNTTILCIFDVCISSWDSINESAVDTNTRWSIDNQTLINNSGILEVNKSYLNFSMSLYNNATLSLTDTNESSRFGNLTIKDCPGSDKMIGVSDNGTVLCSADLTGAGGKIAGGNYLYNDSAIIYSNDTKLEEDFNQTGLITRSNASWLLDTSYNSTYDSYKTSLNNTGFVQRLINATNMFFAQINVSELCILDICISDWSSINQSDSIDYTNLAWTNQSNEFSGDQNFTGNIQMDNTNISNLMQTQYNISGCTSDDEGTFCYDTNYDTMRFVTISGQVLQMNQETTMPAKNVEGKEVADGSIVYLMGATGANPNFKLANASNLSESGLVGVVTKVCVDNQVCPVVFFGLVHGFKTDIYSAGDHLYLSDLEVGNFSTIPPIFPNVPVWVSTVVRVHETEGTIFVFPRLDPSNGITMNDLGLIGDLIQTDYKIRSVEGNSKIDQNVFTIYMNGTSGQDIPHLVLQPGGGGQANIWVRSGIVAPEVTLCLNNTNRTEPSCYAGEGNFAWKIDFNSSIQNGSDWGITGNLEVIKDSYFGKNITVSGFANGVNLSNVSEGPHTIDTFIQNYSGCPDGSYGDGNGACNDFNASVSAATASTTYYPTQFSITYGTGGANNNIGNLSFIDGQYFNVTEASGPNALEFYVNFTGVDKVPDFIQLGHKYDGSHEIELQLWDYENSLWEVYERIEFESSLVKVSIGIIDGENHVDSEIIQMRFIHPSNGINGELFSVDFINLINGFSTVTTTEHDGLSSRANVGNHPLLDSWIQGLNTTSAIQSLLNATNVFFDKMNASEICILDICIGGWDSINQTFTDTNWTRAALDANWNETAWATEHLNETDRINVLNQTIINSNASWLLDTSYNATYDAYVTANYTNRSNHWDDLNSYNATQFESSDNLLNLMESWITSFVDDWLGTKDTDDLSEGSSNLYEDGRRDNATYVAQISSINNSVNVNNETTNIQALGAITDYHQDIAWENESNVFEKGFNVTGNINISVGNISMESDGSTLKIFYNGSDWIWD